MISKKTFLGNLLVFSFLLIFLEAIFGYWFSEYNFGYHMRDKRLITYKINTTINNNKYDFNYIRNFYGFRKNNDIEPREIDLVFQGGSTADEMPLPFHATIVGQLNKMLRNDNINNEIINAALSGKSTAGYNNDFKYWFPRLKGFNPKIMVFFSGHNDADIMQAYENRLDKFDIEIENKTYSDKFYKRVYDYLTNNSFFLIHLKKIKDLHFDLEGQKVLYDLDKENLYENFSYIDYKTALKIYDNKSQTPLQIQTVKFYRNNLKQLKNFIDNWNIRPIFVTQARYDGISTNRLFLINEETKKFCEKYNYTIIKLDETYAPEINDYFDNIHTSPKGSLKMAKIIYPQLKEEIIKLDLEKVK